MDNIPNPPRPSPPTQRLKQSLAALWKRLTPRLTTLPLTLEEVAAPLIARADKLERHEIDRRGKKFWFRHEKNRDGSLSLSISYGSSPEDRKYIMLNIKRTETGVLINGLETAGKGRRLHPTPHPEDAIEYIEDWVERVIPRHVSTNEPTPSTPAPSPALEISKEL